MSDQAAQQRPGDIVAIPPPSITAEAIRLPRPERLYDRDEELGVLDQHYRQGREGRSAPSVVLNYFGPPGIGKTALLATMADTLRVMPDCLVFELNFAALFPYRSTHPNPRLALLAQISAWVAPLNQKAHSALLRRLSMLSAEASDQDFDEIMTQAVAALPSEGLIALALDAWDHTPALIAPWLERLLILPLLVQNRLLALCSSQVELRWWSFEVRRRSLRREVRAISAAASAAQVGLAIDHAEQVYRVTFGYPLANEHLRQQVDQTGPAALEAPARPPLLRAVLAAIGERVPPRISHELQEAIKVIALFREFDVSTLRGVLPTFLAEFRLRSQSSLLETIKELLATRLVRWQDTNHAYAFERTIRRLYEEALRLEQPERYSEVRAAAVDYYRRLVTDIPASRNTYVVELCYQLLYRGTIDSYNTIPTLLEELTQILERHYRSRDGSAFADSDLALLHELFLHDEEISYALEAAQAAPNLLAAEVERFRRGEPQPRPQAEH